MSANPDEQLNSMFVNDTAALKSFTMLLLKNLQQKDEEMRALHAECTNLRLVIAEQQRKFALSETTSIASNSNSPHQIYADTTADSKTGADTPAAALMLLASPKQDARPCPVPGPTANAPTNAGLPPFHGLRPLTEAPPPLLEAPPPLFQGLQQGSPSLGPVPVMGSPNLTNDESLMALLASPNLLATPQLRSLMMEHANSPGNELSRTPTQRSITSPLVRQTQNIFQPQTAFRRTDKSASAGWWMSRASV